MKMYGPYTRKDGRKHVIWIDGDVRRTQSYPRYLMEKHLNRKLLPEEHVDHINEDHTDNKIENFQLLPQLENTKKSIKPARKITKNCAFCEREFEILERRYHANQIVQGKAGPYCSKTCAGKAHH